MICAIVHYNGHRSIKLGMLACTSTNAFLIMFSGFFISLRDAPVGWKWLFYLSPGYYTFSSVFRINCEGLFFSAACTSSALAELLPCLTQNSGDVYLRTYGYEDVNLAVHAAVLLAFHLAFGGTAWLVLIAEHHNITLQRLCYILKGSPAVVERGHRTVAQLMTPSSHGKGNQGYANGRSLLQTCKRGLSSETINSVEHVFEVVRPLFGSIHVYTSRSSSEQLTGTSFLVSCDSTLPAESVLQDDTTPRSTAELNLVNKSPKGGLRSGNNGEDCD